MFCLLVRDCCECFVYILRILFILYILRVYRIPFATVQDIHGDNTFASNMQLLNCVNFGPGGIQNENCEYSHYLRIAHVP